MRALLKRYIKSISASGLFASLFGQLGVRSIWVLVTGSAATLGGLAVVWLAMMILMGLVMLVVLVVRTPLSVRARWHHDVVDPLVESTDEYCLLLHPFGYDGEVILPVLPPAASNDLPWYKRPGAAQGPIQRTKTIEQVIAESVRQACGMKTYSVVDQGIAFAPPGPGYLRALNDRWHLPVHRLIARAHTILVLLPPDVPIGRGLEWEMSQIAYLGLQSRVVFVLPPPERHEGSGCPSVHRLSHLMALLKHGAAADPATIRYQANEYQESLLDWPIIAWLQDGTHARGISGDSGDPDSRRAKRRRVAVETYTSGLVPRLRENGRQLGDLGFEARYEARHWPALGPVNSVEDWRAVTARCAICDHPPVARKRRRRATVVGLVATTLLTCGLGAAGGIRHYGQDTAETHPVPPTPSVAPAVDLCVVGRWQVLSPWSPSLLSSPVPSRSASSSIFSTPSPALSRDDRGVVYEFRRDGTGTISWNDARLSSLKVGDSVHEVIARGYEEFGYEAGAEQIDYRYTRAKGALFTRWKTVIMTDTLSPALPPESYSCSGSELTLGGPSADSLTGEWQVRLSRQLQ